MVKKIIVIGFINLLVLSAANAEWKQLFSQMGNKNVWAGVEVFDENSISMPGVMDNMGNSQPILGYSSDGTNVTMGQPPQNTDAQMSIFVFISGAGSNGFLAGMSLLKGFPPPVIIDVAKSSNKGKSYSIQNNVLPASKNFGATSIYFSDPMTGWILGGGDTSYYLASTKDAGETWTESTDFYPYKEKISLNNIFFINDRIGWIVGGDNGEKDEEGNYTRTPSGGFLLVSTDGGKTFKELYTNNSITLNAAFFLDCQQGLIAGYDDKKAYVFYTNDGGKTLISSGDLKIPSGNTLYDVSYVPALQLLNPDDGFLAANYLSDPTGESCMPAIFKTSDGGKTWSIDDSYGSDFEGFSKYACINDMQFYSERVGYVVGQHLLVAKYTNANGSSENHRCVECMLGRCHQQEIPDAGTDVIANDIIYPDGEIPETMEDTGPVITCPSDKILPMMDTKVCTKDSTISSLNAFKANVGFAEIINGTSFVVYIIGEKDGVTLAQARDAANNKTENVDYIKISVSASMKVSEMYGYSGLSFTGSDMSAQIIYDDSSQVLKIKGLDAEIIGIDNQKKGKIEIDVEVPVLTPKQLSNASQNLINEICNLNRLSCGGQVTDSDIIIGEDQEIINPDDTRGGIDASVISDTSTNGATSDGCSCSTLF